MYLSGVLIMCRRAVFIFVAAAARNAANDKMK